MLAENRWGKTGLLHTKFFTRLGFCQRIVHSFSFIFPSAFKMYQALSLCLSINTHREAAAGFLLPF